MTVYMCISVRGILRWDKRETKRMLKSVTRRDGTRYSSVEDFREAMMEELATATTA